MGSLSDGIVDAFGKGRRLILTGTVAAIDSTEFALTVSLASGTLTGVRWISSYAPTLGDFVVLLRDEASGWIVMGKLSKSLTSAPATTRGTLILAPAAYWLSTFSSGAYSWSASAELRQGTVTAFNESGYYPTYATMAYWSPTILSTIPSGATITSAKLTLTRSAPNRPGMFYPGGEPDTGPTLVYPSLRLHATAAMPSSGSAPWLAGYGVWKPGQLGLSESGTWDLPSPWLTAILAGTATGIGVSNESPWTDYARWVAPSPLLTITYII